MKIIIIILMTMLTCSILAASPLSPILDLKMKGVNRSYDLDFKIFNDMSNRLAISNKGKKVATCDYSILKAEYNKNSRVPHIKMDLKLKKCLYIFDQHRDLISLSEKAYLKVSKASKSEYGSIFLAVDDNDSIKGEVISIDIKAIEKKFGKILGRSY